MSKRTAKERCRRAPRWCAHAFAGAAAVWALAAASVARADICKYVDPDGKIHYSNVPPEKGWKRQSCTDSVTNDFPAKKNGSGNTTTAKSATPGGFPKVDAQTQKGRDDVRRKVLTEELGIEEKLLAEARKVYAEGAPAPLPEEKADADKYRDRIARLRQTVTVHEKNVEALKKEIASIR